MGSMIVGSYFGFRVEGDWTKASGFRVEDVEKSIALRVLLSMFGGLLTEGLYQ